ncbi:MAG: arylsulfatase [Cyclobacteriaceae bacterium]|nr:arylsulfatase [Cyclobacteriaceae bacterium]
MKSDFILVSILFFSTTFLQPVVAQSDKLPNIIFIMADDLGYGDLGVYGQKLIQTPAIDALANEGIRFTQAYAGGPVCTPSRSVLMTGLHNGHTPARDNVPHYHTYLQKDDVTFPEILKSAGYRTAGVGKWSLGDAGTEGSALNKGFDSWTGYLNQDHAHYYYPEYMDLDHGILELPNNSLLRSHYSHDILTNAALKFIRESRNKPFFLYAAYTVPHFSPIAEDENRFTVPDLSIYSDKNWPLHAKKYASMIDRLDRDIGRILSLLDELNLSDNTLIIFTSDNGGHSTTWAEFNTSGPLRGHKGELTEGGIRVPFIAKWPNKIPSGIISEEMVGFQDIMPTFAEMVGKKCPDDIDGISVLEALKGNKLKKPHPFLYWDYGHCRDVYSQALRYGKWKGIRNGLHSALELYNLENDLGEQQNVAHLFPKMVEEIEKIMSNCVLPSDKYTIGEIYTGKPIWKKTW